MVPSEQHRKIARETIRAWMSQYAIWCPNADHGHSYLAEHIAAALAQEREACAGDVESLLDMEWAKVSPSAEAVKVCAQKIRQRSSAP